MPILTLDQYCFIFFAESFTHHNLISENIFHLKNALNKHRDQSALLKLAHSVLHNFCDENFFLVFRGLRSSMSGLFENVYFLFIMYIETFFIKLKV